MCVCVCVCVCVHACMCVCFAPIVSCVCMSDVLQTSKLAGPGLVGVAELLITGVKNGSVSNGR